MLADTYTPVSTYLKLRDRFPRSILLESSDYHGAENSYSYICVNPISSFKLENGTTEINLPDGKSEVLKTDRSNAVKLLEDFRNCFSIEMNGFPFITQGLFGYISYDSISYFEDIEVSSGADSSRIPEIIYSLYSHIIVFDHFKNEIHLFEHTIDGMDSEVTERIISILQGKNIPDYTFSVQGEENSVFSDKEFDKILHKGIDHCLRGDVFQVVLSRRFQRSFKGDEFNVYRMLRSINPSPYLFYFDLGSFKIFGSSPEAQIVIKDRVANIYPIAGTYRRTGDDLADAENAKALSEDEKENAEHAMLVDLARNDLNKNATDVKVDTYKEIQYYSHVIHLVSKVTGKLNEGKSGLSTVSDTFPAGTLSGAPKHMAMQLIDKYEKNRRGYYGGAVGYLGLNGDFNHAIMIRSFLSKGNVLYYQAGAGVVAKSNPGNEFQEVNNKLEALRKAITMAETLN